MLFSCTNMATVGVKELTQVALRMLWRVESFEICPSPQDIVIIARSKLMHNVRAFILYVALLTTTCFSTVCKLCSEYFCSSCKSEILIRWCSSQQNSFPNSYYEISKCLASYHMLHFTWQSFYVRFTKIINVGKIINAFIFEYTHRLNDKLMQ